MYRAPGRGTRGCKGLNCSGRERWRGRLNYSKQKGKWNIRGRRYSIIKGHNRELEIFHCLFFLNFILRKLGSMYKSREDSIINLHLTRIDNYLFATHLYLFYFVGEMGCYSILKKIPEIIPFHP